MGRDGLVVEVGRSREQEAAVPPRGATGDEAGIDRDDALAKVKQLVHRRETAAAKSDHADIGSDRAVESWQSCPATIFPTRLIGHCPASLVNASPVTRKVVHSSIGTAPSER